MSYDFGSPKNKAHTHPGLRHFQEIKERKRIEAIARKAEKDAIKTSNPTLTDEQVNEVWEGQQKERKLVKQIVITNRQTHKQYNVIVKTINPL